jgi:K+-sensing histidine kinase KdpD
MSHDSGHGGGYVEKVREEMQSYVRSLLEDNEKVRQLLAKLEGENARLSQELRAAREEAAAHEAHEEELHRKLLEVRSETESFRTQFAELEHHSANLANLYVASYQLNGTLDRAAVLTAMQEIIVNLIGSEEFGVFEWNEDERSLEMVTSIGGQPAETVLSFGGVASAFASGQPWIAPAETDAAEALACIPLKLDERITGLIVIHRLLRHKAALDPLDYELFSLLATHAATALYCTALHERMRPAEALAS